MPFENSTARVLPRSRGPAAGPRGRSSLRPDLVIVACSISAGIHGALTPEHFREGGAPGGGFVAATVILLALALAATRRPTLLATVVAAVAFAGLIGSYALAVTTGVPLLHPDVEQVDGLALATKAIEAMGLLAALSLLRRHSNLRPKGRLT
jgi:hypothetical protein